jgi:hypothetical protein
MSICMPNLKTLLSLRGAAAQFAQLSSQSEGFVFRANATCWAYFMFAEYSEEVAP